MIGLIIAIVLVFLEPIVWVDILGYKTAIFPFKCSVLFSVSIAFLTIYLISILDNSQQAQNERDAFEAQEIRSQTGIGAEGASTH